ncbi:MAG: hypothetical protein DYG94_14175 [Leptolyngbya sp. PLA3]|nr:MAG: hypothetical protein EDM82_14820 [Cyanobacteria bacterium CYA]MCE7969875.1 hypothetical protein [Leptolyngbya sp. PL-A3]
MVSKSCDRCERTIEFPDDRAGSKVECPYCGDMNMLPALSGVHEPAGVATGRTDRASAAGYPPDTGPEQRVMMVRPAWVRSQPFRSIGSMVLAAGGLVLGLIHLIDRTAVPGWAAIIAILAALGFGGVVAWWWIQSLSAALEVTTKRTVAKRGIFSRSTSEVLHDNIRNVRIEQSFWQRVWGVGSIGISSSGQDGIEIQMDRIPGPQRLQQVIDLYRPLE